MRGKLMFISGLAAGFVLGSRAGREKYEEIRANAKKVWEHPTVQEAAGVAQAQANKLYTEGKDKINQSKLGEKLHSSSSSDTDTSLTASSDTLSTSSDPLSTSSDPLTASSDSLTGSSSTTSTRTTGTSSSTY